MSAIRALRSLVMPVACALAFTPLALAGPIQTLNEALVEIQQKRGQVLPERSAPLTYELVKNVFKNLDAALAKKLGKKTVAFNQIYILDVPHVDAFVASAHDDLVDEAHVHFVALHGLEPTTGHELVEIGTGRSSGGDRVRAAIESNDAFIERSPQKWS